MRSATAIIICYAFCLGVMPEAQAAQLQDSDCGKCHFDIATQVAQNGGRHKDYLGCLGCHQAHPPQGEAIIPACADCHAPADRSHFQLDNCRRCHTPHEPVLQDFTRVDQVKPACLSCHEDVGTALEKHPSAHSAQDCNFCHQEHGTAQGQTLTCTNCHNGHGGDLKPSQCQQCHRPHAPTDYAWQGQIPDKHCGLCHSQAHKTLQDEGGAHRDMMACTGCHSQHPPAEEGVIPACADCHAPQAQPHFQLDNCQSCHGAHTPQIDDLSSLENARPACLSCHEQVGKQMQAHPNAHSEQPCVMCHQQHGAYQQCLNCHSGHSDDMQHRDCLRCHQAHTPQRAEYAQTPIADKLCASCHSEPLTQLKKGHSRHSQLGCIFCHPQRHKTMRSCDMCHGQPHSPDLHAQHDGCHKCHATAHNLKGAAKAP